jgi:uncharacterized protein (TIGR00299 family) protein
MKIAIIDCFAGISGDMTLAALIECGVPTKYLVEQLDQLRLSGYELLLHKTKRQHIAASKIDVKFETKNQPERTYKSIVKMIENSGLASDLKEKSLQAFKILGTAEAKIHDTQLEMIHFHEIGAIDSIIDLVGSIIGFTYLGIDEIYTGPVPLGTGFTKTEHGIMPVPSPAALEILKDYPVIYRESDYEMTTPTGATLVKLLSRGLVPDNFSFITEKQGYGAGDKDTSKWPNLLRLIIGHKAPHTGVETLTMVETNIDDMNTELFPYIIEELYQAGAKDVFLTPIMMKKGRPGNKLSVLTEKINLNVIEKIVFSETSTIGLRKYDVERKVLARDIKTIDSRFGKIKVKLITLNGVKIMRPEYEQCKKIAKKYNITLMEVYREIDHLNYKNDE